MFLSFSPFSLSRLLVLDIDFKGREIACLAAALGPLARLAAAIGPVARLAAVLCPLSWLT